MRALVIIDLEKIILWYCVCLKYFLKNWIYCYLKFLKPCWYVAVRFWQLVVMTYYLLPDAVLYYLISYLKFLQQDVEPCHWILYSHDL